MARLREKDPALARSLVTAPADLRAFAEDRGKSHIVVACSGGVDSMVLAERFLATVRQGAELQVTLAHVNFGLRAQDSDADESFVRDWAEAAGISATFLRVDAVAHPRTKGEGTQEWARRIRYTWLRELATPQTLVALGHHLDDAAENVLFRMVRGAAPGRLLGMLPEHEGIWRPFLGLAKSEIQEFAARQQIPHRHDESNDKLIYTRNRIRHLVIPEFDKLHRGSAGRIVEMAAEAKSLQDWCDAHFTATLPGGPRLDGAILAGLPRGVATHALAAFLRREGATSISRRLLHAVCARIDMRDAPPWQEELPGGGAVRVAKGQVTVLPYIKLQVSDKTSKK